MLRTIENKEYQQLKLISELAARQLFFQEILMNLAKAVKMGEGTETAIAMLEEAFPSHINANNALVQLLKDVGVLTLADAVEEEEVEKEKEHVVIKDEPSTVGKPTFTIVK